MKTDTELQYIEAQLLRTCPMPVQPDNGNGQLRLKLHSERGESNWLNITPEQFKAIELVLLGK